MTAATATALAVTLTNLARQAASQPTHEPYRDADTGAWTPAADVPRPTGASGHDAQWRTYLAMATAAQPVEPVATGATAGYLLCGACGYDYDVEPGDEMWCPACGPEVTASAGATT